jgi:hypothetical protein
MLSVLCCGCLRVMGDGGTLLGESDATGGVLDLSKLAERFSNLKGVSLTFSDRISADSAAIGFGWSVRDSDGTPNHRCPECHSRYERDTSERTGAYIEWH